MIKDNLSEINKKIDIASKKSGRVRDDIILIGVTKTIDVKRIQELVNFSVIDLGENKVQEFLEKEPVISGSINWHIIGSLQKNKVKYIVGKVYLIHSVDSIELLEVIDKQAEKCGVIQDILLQINIGKEDTKHGFLLEEMDEVFKKASIYKNVKIKGLMCIAPFVEDPEENRPCFKIMKDIFDKYSNISYENIDMKYLSMGMTNDYLVAIEEGANMVRIGTGIFGERNYK